MLFAVWRHKSWNETISVCIMPGNTVRNTIAMCDIVRGEGLEIPKP